MKISMLISSAKFKENGKLDKEEQIKWSSKTLKLVNNK